MQDMPCMNRRTFVKSTGALGALAAVGGAAATGANLFNATEPAHAESEEKIVYTHCAVNCGCCCVWKCHVQDGEIKYIESDNTGSGDFADPQMRACLRGRSARRWLQSSERLNYPMKRAEGAKRGEGKFERISWDEALDTIASEMKRIREKYGDESMYLQYASGVTMGVWGSSPVGRLLNLTGGYLTYYGTYSNGQLMRSSFYTYGEAGGYGSNYQTLQDNELVVMFGSSPVETRMGGTGQGNNLVYAREKHNLRIINIDPRLNDTAAGDNTEWIPIRTGTDAALCAALSYEIINNGWADEEFLHKYCVGYDEETLPESAKGKNASYKDYILGTGYDMTPKTPAWASKITLVPEQRIKDLAREMHEANPVFITQGYGSQRHSNGEATGRAIMVLPQLLGQIGKPGMNDGRRENKIGFAMSGFPAGKNAVSTQIPFFLWYKAIEAPETMTNLNSGIMKAEKLKSGIKFLFNYAGNALTNQHSDINHSHDVLVDESKCEFIVCCDVFMTDSCKYADIILPDLTSQEQLSLVGAPYNDNLKAIIYGQPVYEEKFERRGIYEVCSELAKRLGVYDEYTDGGKTREDWTKKLYEDFRAKNPQIPTWEEGVKMGFYKEERVGELIAHQKFIADPEANPLKTPSGKIEIYSEDLAKIRDTWDLEEGTVEPIPFFDPGFESYQDLSDEYPLLIQGFHYKAHTHSSYANNQIVQDAAPHFAWMNPADAESRGIKDGDTVKVFNDRGEIRILAKVTPRAMPGHVFIPQGSWHNADMSGDRVDYGGCINTLTIAKPTPLGKCNPQHSNVGQVEKA
ncbi:dimethyl sulfoxide reductase subunit A [Senegalimassilia faecalis]|uniref:Dimethyl sulfoxide reductase subunit A n=1 Tax=Senegalimassilia faecalis TaxID=2509433 RepID=A0A4Q2K132_9ACTN|nr:DMSO/selenate family reductase complex A subunit [Senegalimassilia faecalis]RXZ53950.1 dimethyl sulfoxide reductase subunit A [Senegalimassilia faecalis]